MRPEGSVYDVVRVCTDAIPLSLYRNSAEDASRAVSSPEAVIHARARLGVEPMRIFFETHAAEVKPIASFHGHRVCAVDGTGFNVPDTAANEAHFGRPKSSRGETAYPQMDAVSLVETSTSQILDMVFTHCDVPERLGVLKLLERLIRNDLLLMDRGISAAWLFAECLRRKIRILGRISSTWKPHVIRRLGSGDFLVTVEGEIPKELRKNKKATVKLTLRMIEYKIGNNGTVRLLTDLLDPNEYPDMELAKLYHARWQIETSYDEIKNHLATVASSAQDLVFRSKTPEGILQEAYALAALYNMIRCLMAEAGAAAPKPESCQAKDEQVQGETKKLQAEISRYRT
ncbi:MAG: IS4 family transposase [Armatimonadetes bacterium]|nr:IS4 family transposase [Armatimonadota bacterium]